jgi:16S rRNA (guanine527-N7)-methyltransferase
MDLIEFWTICSSNGIILTKEQIEQLKRYYNELLYWNSKVNLISRKDEEYFLDRHILHSLSILKYIEIPPKSNCLDVGTGGGLPGIPLAIANPEINMLLVDSIAKKMKITSMMAKHTELKKLNTICERVELLSNNKDYKNKFDFVFARAVTDTSKIIGWVKDLIKPKGKIVLLKGGDLTDEIENALQDRRHKTEDIRQKTQDRRPKTEDRSQKSVDNVYTSLKIKEIPIKLFGYDWFEKEEKKIVICEFNN